LEENLHKAGSNLEAYLVLNKNYESQCSERLKIQEFIFLHIYKHHGKCCAANANGFCVYLQPQGADIQANYLILIEMPQGENMEST